MKDNTIVFVPGSKALRSIEAYTEKICENLFINDTYFGNILMCLTELNELFNENGIRNEVELSYQTDFTDLIINANIIESEDYIRLKTNKDLSQNDVHYHIIETLSDGVQILDDGIILEFNISALHKSIYESRLNHIKIYFNKMVGVNHES